MVDAEVRVNSSNTAILPVKKKLARSNIRILLIDDSNSVRETLNSYLAPQPDFAIVGSFNNARAAMMQIETLNPDIVLMDIDLPKIDGFKVTQKISRQFEQIKIIVLSSHVSETHITQALNSGAKGYLLKSNLAEELVFGIRFVEQGYLHFSPGLLEQLSTGRTAIAPATPSPTPTSSEIVLVNSGQIQSNDWSSQTKELIDTLPKVWTRGLLYFMAIFTAIALPWAMFSQVDETGTAKGRLEPSGRTFILDAPVAGTVAKINVEAGDMVEVGQSLLELESDLVAGKLEQLQTQLVGQENQLQQLKLLSKQFSLMVDIQGQESQAQQLEKQAQIEQARQQLQFYRKSYSSQKQEKLAQVNQAEQDVAYSQTALNSAAKALAKAQTEIERYREAWQEGVIAEVQVIEKEDLIAQRQQDFDRAKSELQQAKLRLAEQENSYAQVVRQAESDTEKAQLQLQEQEKGDRTLTHRGKLSILKSQEQLKNTESEIATLSTEIAQTKSKIVSTQYELKQRAVKTPVSGTVFDLPVQKSGEVLQPGDAVAEIAPQGSPLVVMAAMATAESGSLAEGMPVKLKFDAYPFQEYGVVEGTLTGISPTSKVTETERGRVANYNLEIEFDRNCLSKGDRCIPLRPGDTVTAEVIIRQRRIVDFILDPFKQLQQGGLKL